MHRDDYVIEKRFDILETTYIRLTTQQGGTQWISLWFSAQNLWNHCSI